MKSQVRIQLIQKLVCLASYVLPLSQGYYYYSLLDGRTEAGQDEKRKVGRDSDFNVS